MHTATRDARNTTKPAMIYIYTRDIFTESRNKAVGVKSKIIIIKKKEQQAEFEILSFIMEFKKCSLTFTNVDFAIMFFFSVLGHFAPHLKKIYTAAAVTSLEGILS